MTTREPRNNTNFPLQTYEFLRSLKYVDNPLEMYHQWIIRQYMIHQPEQRGLLVTAGMGWGKTRIGAMNVKELIEQAARSNRRVMVIGPKLTQGRFRDEFIAVGVTPERAKYISFRANNLMEQVERKGQDAPAADSKEPQAATREFSIAESDMDVYRHAPLDHSVLLFDEAHDFFNAITNGSENAVQLYDTIMTARDIKIFFFTGTPITNDPFELAVAYNMLAGKRLFPESEEDFNKYFVTREGHVKNADVFRNRIFGLTSYFGDWITTNRQNRPARLPTEVLQIPMSERQYAAYTTHRDRERRENARPKRRAPAGRFAKSKASSSYRVRSRQASNYIGGDVTDEANCPKFHAAYNIVEKRPKQFGMVYSNFVHDAGLADFAKLLDARGWEQWDGESTTPADRYAFITSETPEDYRIAVERLSKGDKNLNGEIVRLILVGPAGSQGIEFYHGRYCIQMDPFFNGIRGDQVSDRFDRINSHNKLPKSKRNVQTYYLLAVAPKAENLPKANLVEDEAETTDEYIYRSSKKRKRLALEFFKLAIESSIDCSIHRASLPKDRAAQIHCMMCAPTGQPLFSDRIDHDVGRPNPCQESSPDEVRATEIIVDDVQYMYDDKGKFFRYHEDLGGYTEVPRNDPAYAKLTAAVEAELLPKKKK